MQTAFEEVLQRSAVYEAFALALTRPDEAVLERLRGAPPPFAPENDNEDLASRYESLFGHTARGRVSPFGTEWGGDGDLFFQPRELCDIGAFLSAFGLERNPQSHERIDHVRVQLELMAFLARKEAFATGAGDEAMLAETRKAERLFLRDHLGRFVPALGAKLEREDSGGFYGRLGAALRRFVEEECARADVTAGPAALRVSLPVVDDAPMACGSCDSPSVAGAGCEEPTA